MRYWLKSYLGQFSLIIKIKRLIFQEKASPIDIFLHDFFSSSEDKAVVQIGANDGIMCDPLRQYLINPSNYQAILVEPLPYYFNKLKKLYKNRKDILLINKAIGQSEEIKSLYFIPPNIADHMNGDGPQSNWAHGQGSFDKNIVMHWIKQNEFRGNEYREKVSYFIENIAEEKVVITQTKNILPNTKNLLLVIDVQGFELDVLKGIDYQFAPKYILLEDDLNNGEAVVSFLKANGYELYCSSNTDKVFININH